MDAIEGEWDVWSLFFVDATMEVFSSDSLVSSHPVVHEKQIANRDDLKMFFDLSLFFSHPLVMRDQSISSSFIHEGNDLHTNRTAPCKDSISTPE